MIAQAIQAARRQGKPIGICGQAPSDYPEFAEWLVREHIDSISLNPDAAIAMTLRVAAAESSMAGESTSPLTELPAGNPVATSQ
jgi:pyruvate,water dikinase